MKKSGEPAAPKPSGRPGREVDPAQMNHRYKPAVRQNAAGCPETRDQEGPHKPRRTAGAGTHDPLPGPAAATAPKEEA
jgi:hypothetical protein